MLLELGRKRLFCSFLQNKIDFLSKTTYLKFQNGAQNDLIFIYIVD